MINKKIVYSSLMAFIFLTGCGNDIKSGSFTMSNNEGNLTGVFIDSEVEGVKYMTSSGVEGYTNAKGEYNYNDGDEITFYLGDMNLGSTEASNLTTVFELPDSTKVATLLQLLDKDGNPNNGISISDEDYRIFKNADFELKEVDAQSIAFRKKFKDTMGYDIETDSKAIQNHALESLKDELVRRYDNDIFKYLNEEFDVSGIIGASNDSNTIYGKNPNDYLNTYEARLRVYFYKKYIDSSINSEIALYDNAIRQTDITKEAVDKTAEKLTSNIVKFYSLIGLFKGTIGDIKDLKNIEKTFDSSKVYLHADVNKEYLKAVSKFAIKKIGIDRLGKTYITELANKDTFLGRVFSDCLITGKPNVTDLLTCESRLSGEAGKQLNGALGEYNKLVYLRKRNAMILVGHYIDLYYIFNRDKNIFYKIFEKMAKEEGRELSFTFEEFQNMNYTYLQKLDEIKDHNIFEITSFDVDVLKSENILREFFDILSEKVFGNNFAHISDETVAGWQYNFNYGTKNLVKYISTVEDLTNYFTEVVDKKSMREIDTDYIDFDVQLFPAGEDDSYEIAFQLTNNTQFDLKATRGYVTVELDGKQIDKVVFFKEQVDGKNLNENQIYSESSKLYQSKIFTIPTDKKVLTNGVLKVSYKVDYIPSRHNVGEKVQEGIKYYELSKKTLIDDLSKPLIDLEIPKFIKVDEEVKLDASSTTSIIEDDSFTYNWEYLSTDNQDNIRLTNSTSAIASIKVSKVPNNLAFQRHDFKLTVISNINKKESTKEFSIFVKNEKQEEETVDDNTETSNNQDDNSDTSLNNSNTEDNANNNTPSTDTPSNSSRTSIEYMKNHKTEKLASTDCKVRNYKGWKDAKNELIYSLAPADNMMKSIEGCIDVIKLTELGGLSFSKAVESVVRSRTKETSPFSDVWDNSARETPTLTVDEVTEAQNNADNSSNLTSGTLTIEKCKSKYGNYTNAQWASSQGSGEYKGEATACYQAIVVAPSMGIDGQSYIDAYNRGVYGK